MSTSSLDFDPASIVLPKGHFIGGSYVSLDEDEIAVFRPSDGQLLGHVMSGSAETVDHAVQQALRAVRETGWATQAPRDRAKVLFRWAALIEQHAEALAKLEAVSSTRPVADAYRTDVPYLVDTIRFFAEWADKLGGDVAATRSSSMGFVASEPYGVVGAITPWNFPLTMAGWKVGAALAAGNAVILKPSELTPFSTLRLADLAVEAGVPAGIFNVVNGRGATTGSAITQHPDIAKISFTGSTQTGAIIMSEAAFHGTKPVTLELGGKSPQLVFAEVPSVEHVAHCIARGFTLNGGQVCVAGSRLIVHEKIADELLAAITKVLAPLAPGKTWQSETTYSPIINEAQFNRIAGIVDATCAEGAEAIVGGELFEGTAGGYYYRPTVLVGVSSASPAVKQEVFGPVLTVQTFHDEEEGLALASHPMYGLAAGVHTRDISQALRATRRLAAGTIWINRYGRSSDMIIPTGGFKRSGIGKDLGRQAMEANLRHKSVLIDFDDAS